MTALPVRVRKTLRERMIRAVVGGGTPYTPAVVWYVDNVPALSWSESGGISLAHRRVTRAQAITSECFPPRYSARCEQRPDVLRRVIATLGQWSSDHAQVDTTVGGAR